MSRRINTPASHINGNYNQPRGIPNFHRGARGGNSDNRGEGWRCAECNVENYAVRMTCFRYNKARDCQRSERTYNQQNQPQRGAENNRGAPRGNGSGNRGRGGYNQAVAGTSTGNQKRQWGTGPSHCRRRTMGSKKSANTRVTSLSRTCLLYTSRCV